MAQRRDRLDAVFRQDFEQLLLRTISRPGGDPSVARGTKGVVRPLEIVERVQEGRVANEPTAYTRSASACCLERFW